MLTLFAFFNAFIYAVYASNVVYLDKGNFSDVVGKGKPGLVELYVFNAGPVFSKPIFNLSYLVNVSFAPWW